MAMYFTLRENAELLGIDEKDARRIVNAASSLTGVMSRDRSFIIKNGPRNNCTFHLLKSSKEFAPLLASLLSGSRQQHIGLYIYKRISSESDIYERLMLAADTGRIQGDISDIAVIPNRNIDSAMGYIDAARKGFPVDFTFIYDESGKRDEICSLHGSELETVHISPLLESAVRPHRPTFERFKGDMEEIEGARITRFYRYNAALVCREFLRSALQEFWGMFVRHSVLLLSPEISRELVGAITCGQDVLSLSEEGFPWAPMLDDENDCPKPLDNASHNLPDGSCHDMRSFAFSDSDEFLKQLAELAPFIHRMRGVTIIWEKILERNAGNADVDKLVDLIHARAVSPAKAKEAARLMRRVSKSYGIYPMIEFYYAGVPLEDILA